MSRTVLEGRFSYILRSIANSLAVTLLALSRRALGRPLNPHWTLLFEIGTLFWRAQFNRAFALKNIAEGRAYFDTLCPAPDNCTEVAIRASQPGQPAGDWFVPRRKFGDTVVLYFHGGGYAFYAKVTRQFIMVLADWLGLTIFAPNYRLTPENPHPAQIEDGISAYQFLVEQGIDPKRIVICGDSAGGHLTLMTLVKIRELGLSQPALAIGLSPWTDTGRRGESLFGNNPHDMVQGYMALQFSDWLKGGANIEDCEISPMYTAAP